ncbi:MAG: WYL domain-containing protein [Bifidobacteriaceae bacterium]|jgi:proteasome accessory factor C|nr:WYL domain-containing protein [Bifidobacteriaceae bacterium]
MAERETAAERLPRLLALVGYLGRERSAAVEELAEHFGVSRDQIMRDVSLLWVTGTPGYFPDDLLDFSVDSDQEWVTLVEDQRIGTPLRLTAHEAVALVAALRALVAQPGIADTGAAEAALGKLLAALGESAALAEAVEAGVAPQAAPAAAAGLRAALKAGRAVELDYVDAADARTRRAVDPVRLFTDQRHWMLAAWDRAAGAARTFRLDRILGVRELDLAAGEHAIPIPDSGFSGNATARVQVRFEAAARWLAEELDALEPAVELPGGGLELVLAVGSEAWLRALVLAEAGRVRVLAPAAVRARAAAAAREALDAYGGAP